MNVIMDCAQSAFVSTRSLAELEDALCDGGATSKVTKSLETLVKQKGVDTQTAHDATLMSTTHSNLKITSVSILHCCHCITSVIVWVKFDLFLNDHMMFQD